jgi:competence protein ComEA
MQRLVMLTSAVLLFVPLYLKSRKNQDTPVSAAFHALSSNRILVKVSGEVRHPGIYEVSANQLAVSVINLAEPVRSFQQSVHEFNYSRKLQNGMSLNLSNMSDGTSQVTLNQMTVAESIVLKIPLDISRMTLADFGSLPGVGPILAQRISEYRQKNGSIFHVEDLALVEGIGEKKYKELFGYFQLTENRH